MIDPGLALRIVREDPLIAYDTETDGLDPIKCNPVGYVITNKEHSLYVPVAHESGDGCIPNREGFERELAAAFRDRARLGYRTVGHYLSFDLWMSSKRGIHIRGVLEDTQINESLVNDLADSLALENCAIRHGVTPKLGAELYKAISERFGVPPDRTSMAHFWRMPGDHPKVVEYATGDGVSTLELREAQYKKILEEIDGQTLEQVWRLECSLIPHLADMRLRGMRVDMGKAATIKEDTEASIAAELAANFPPGFNVNSPKQMAEWFKDRLDQFPRTAKGAPSFSEHVLESFEDGQKVLKVRQLRKAVSSFITPLIDTNCIDGRVHPQLVQSKSDGFGAGGGRLSCVEPNLQAFPKRNKVVGEVVRQLIIPDDCMELSESDFSQQEPRLFTHYSEDSNLMAGYLATPYIDIHTIAARITGRPREVAKRLGLGILTGMGQAALAGHMNWALEEGVRGHKEYLGAFPGIKQFQKDAKATMLRKGYVRTLLGRRCHVDDNAHAYKAVSRIIQGSGADHTKTALLAACEYCEAEAANINLLMTIHDSFVSQHTDRKYLAELIRILDSIAPKLGVAVPIPTETGTGMNWSEASYGGKH